MVVFARSMPLVRFELVNSLNLAFTRCRSVGPFQSPGADAALSSGSYCGCWSVKSSPSRKIQICALNKCSYLQLRCERRCLAIKPQIKLARKASPQENSNSSSSFGIPSPNRSPAGEHGPRRVWLGLDRDLRWYLSCAIQCFHRFIKSKSCLRLPGSVQTKLRRKDGRLPTGRPTERTNEPELRTTPSSQTGALPEQRPSACCCCCRPDRRSAQEQYILINKATL